MADSLTTDKTSYRAGETIAVTLKTDNDNVQGLTFNAVLPNGAVLTTSTSVGYAISETTGRPLSKVSDDKRTAVWTAKA